MFQVTLTTQGQISIPAGLRKMIGLGPADKLDLVPHGDGFVAKKASGWQSLQGVLSAHKGKYPTKEQIAQAWMKGHEDSTR